MSSQTEPTDAVPSGFGEISKRRSAADLARSIPPTRQSKPSTARSRISAQKTKNGRVAPLGPTEARLAKGDVLRTGGIHRSIPPIEALRNSGKLAPKSPEEIKKLRPGELPYDFRENQGMYEAGVRLHRHFMGCMIGVKAQDLDAELSRGAHSELEGEEAWVAHYVAFKAALEIMGFYPTRPHHGAARIVVAVVCYEMTLRQAAEEHLHTGRTDPNQAIAMDRLRAGLLALAAHWRMI